MDFLLEILNELNVTTHNIIYMTVGIVISTLIIKRNRKITPMIFLYNESLVLFERIKATNADLYKDIFNLCVIRAICILAHDGEFASRDTNFIENSLMRIDATNEQKEIIANYCHEFLTKIIDFEVRYQEDGLTFISRIFVRRKK